MNNKRKPVWITSLAVLVLVGSAQAQWVMVARAVSGRVQQMQQTRADGKGDYDVATVVLEANATRFTRLPFSGCRPILQRSKS
jgi:hypothetical protein